MVRSLLSHASILKGKGELIVGAATAVRKDHVLVGTSNGVASRVVPYDYLVMSTGTSYQSDIKTDGTSIEARKAAFALERQRCKEAPSFTVVGGGLVGTELAFDLKAFFPEKVSALPFLPPRALPFPPPRARPFSPRAACHVAGGGCDHSRRGLPPSRARR